MRHAVDVPAPTGYLSRVLALATAMRVRSGEIVEIVVSHDEPCEVLRGGRCCSCHPDIALRRGARAS